MVSGIFIIAAVLLYKYMGFSENTNTILTNLELAQGWQLKIPPSDSLKAGSIYRVSHDGYFYRVKTLSIPAETIQEAEFNYATKVITNKSILANYLGVAQVGGDSDQEIQLTLALNNIVREVTYDESVDIALEKMWDNIRYRTNEKYYVIRETRAASQIDIYLNKEQVNSLGGKAKIMNSTHANAAIHSADQGRVKIHGQYQVPMYVMYLPEEIKPLSASFNNENPEFEVYPVQGVLNWKTNTNEASSPP